MKPQNPEAGDAYIVALAGNPNVGKSTLFNALTGMHQHTGNWAGKTVQNAAGRYICEGEELLLVDLPGTYSLWSGGAEEQAARDFICLEKPDAVVVVCDASCLERNLILALQIIETGRPVLVCVNLLDEAEKRGILIDFPKLEELLGVPVVGVTARSRKGIEKFGSCLMQLLKEKADVQEQESDTCTGEDTEAALTETIHRTEAICREAVKKPEDSHIRDRKIDRILLGKYTGIPIMLLLLSAVLWITIVGANYPSQWLQIGFSALGDVLRSLMADAPSWISGALLDGIYNVLTWVIAVMLPPMAIFFPLFTLLEDFGYLPRVAFQLDRRFQCAGACGKQALTMCMGFGCNAAGVTGCRIIESPRERLIAILTNVFVPCNGRFPTLIALITAFFTAGAGGSVLSAGLLVLLILFGIVMTLLIAKLLSATILRGIPSAIVLELPPYRKPQILKVLVRSLLDRTLFVLGRACMVAAPAGLLLWLLAQWQVSGTSVLMHIADFLDAPARFMGLDGALLTAFLLGFPANEIVMPIAVMLYKAQDVLTETGSTAQLHDILTENGWTWVTALCAMIFMLFHFPCSTTCLTIRKETGSTKWMLLGMLLPTLCGIILCSIIARIAALF